MLDFITWNVNPELFSGFVTVRWYGLMFAIGFLVGYEIVAVSYTHLDVYKRQGIHRLQAA